MRIDRVKLITEMARANVGVNALAASTGMSRATITAIRTGKSCQKDTAVRLASALHIPLDNLLEERGPSDG